ncbi:MAG: hypothetical protein WB425_17265 [Terracidiphilus sp.]
MRGAIQHNSQAYSLMLCIRVGVALAALAVTLGGARLAAAQLYSAASYPDPSTIKNPAEFNTYQMASTQADPKAKAAALESFSTAYPQSVVKPAVLDSLIDIYQRLQDANQTLSAATRLLQMDPSNMKALFMSVLIKKSQCAKTSDRTTCDDAGALAQRGLSVKKPDSTTDADWKKLTSGTYPVFHSAIALDDIVSKKDVRGGISEYRTELILYPPEQTTAWPSPGLWDTLQLAEAYTKSDAPDHLVQAVWFYARAWNFATPIKVQIENKLEYYYKKYHGSLDGLDAVKTQAATTLFPPGTFVISPVEMSRKPRIPVSVNPSTSPSLPDASVPDPSIPDASAENPTLPDTSVSEESFPEIPPPAMPLSEMPFAAKPSAPELPQWPVNEKPVEAVITWNSQGLRIDAANSSLQQIMNDVAATTGATVDGLQSDERVFGTYGPGNARDVLTQLLHGFNYNIVMVGDQGEGTPREILLSTRHAETASQTGHPQQPADEDADVDEPQLPQPPVVRPGFGYGGPPRNPQQFMQQRQLMQQQQQPDNLPVPPS